MGNEINDAIDDLMANGLSIPQAAKEVGVSVPTIWRWTLNGSRGIRLESAMVGGRRRIARAALRRFIAATTSARERPTAAPAPAVARDRDRQIQAAETRLAAAGF